MPDGKTTNSAKRYIAAYRKLARPVCRATGAKIHSFDPGIRFIHHEYLKSKGKVISDFPVQSVVFGIPIVVLEKLNKALK